MTTLLELLRQTRELLSDRNRWTTGYYAYDNAGNKCEADNPAAERFCLLGAMWRVSGNFDIAINAGHVLYGDAVKLAGFNDLSTHTQVLGWLDNEVAQLEEFDEGAPVEMVEEPELVSA